MSLNKAQGRYLRGLCHNLSPVVTVADKGLSETVLAEIEQSITRHELVKLKLRASKQQRQDWLEEIVRVTGAEKIQSIGQVACFFRRNPDKPRVAIPDA